MTDAPSIVTFLTDYGLQDPFVGICHGVVARIAPHARVIDLTHAVPAHDVAAGARTLADCVPYLPRGVHLAVVDPGVGTDRRGVVLAAEGGSVLVGPDNGLLPAAADRLGGVSGAWELLAPAYRLSPVSATFHGRDVFAPAAAHLCAGVAPSAFGPAVAPDDLVAAPAEPPRLVAGQLRGEVVAVDTFGNLATNLSAEDLRAVGVRVGDRVRLLAGGRSHDLPLVETFGDARPGALVVLLDAFGRLQIAVNTGSAAARLSVEAGAPVRLAPVGAPPGA